VVTSVRVGTPTPRWLDAETWVRLERRLEAAIRRARSMGSGVLASLSAPVGRDVDPTAVICASRRAGEPWVCLEQPDRDGAAVAAVGCARAVEAWGAGRFREVTARWRSLAASALADPADGPPGSGLVALGGFSFSPTGGGSPPWAGFQPASMIVPELSLARRGDEVRLTVNVQAAPDDTVEEWLTRIGRRLEALHLEPVPMLDPSPTGAYEVVSTMPPSHYEHAVARAVERIRAGELEKIVLAREVQVHAPVEHDPAAMLGILREAFPTCYVFAVGRGATTFLGASPELLLRREGQRVSTVALAGSTRRSADPAVDRHLGEQLLTSDKDRHENAIVARRIGRALAPHSVWVTAAPEPVIVRVANIQHLATPIRAQLASSIGAAELVGLLHPTPAVGGEPSARALEAIPALEGFDRGWYAGAIGWIDATGDGELCVALRCALLRGPVAHCYAGCGIVRDSDPAAELAESEIKLEAMLPLLAG
jgi:salicylate biosynthesis isochorismate synthase/menaquinone-specific isochorismate synthase